MSRNALVVAATRLLAIGGAALVGSALAFGQAASPTDQTKRAQATGEKAATAAEAGRSATLQATERAQQPAARSQVQPAERTQQAVDREARQQNAGRTDRQTEQLGDRTRGNESRDAASGRRQGLGIPFEQQGPGVLVVGNLPQGTAAAGAGLRAQDRIISVDGRQFGNPRQLQAYLSGQYGRRVPIVVEREGRQLSIQLPMQEAGDNVAWLGVLLRENPEGQKGAQVTQVYPAGPAARSGIWPGDVIQQVNGKEVESSADLIALIEEHEPGSKVELTLLRQDKPTKLAAVLGSRSSFIFHAPANDFRGGRDYGQSDQFGEEDDEFSNIPPHAMQLEHDRRMAEQHQRIETELIKLQDEIRQLRELLQRRNQ
jgi:C-terminal processing protease CtpA/Prc